MTHRIITKHCVNAFNQKYITVSHNSDTPRRYAVAWLGKFSNAIIELLFQQGEDDANGITNEALIAVVIDRLERFQEGPFKCRENALTITKLEEALLWQGARAARIEKEDENKERHSVGCTCSHSHWDHDQITAACLIDGCTCRGFEAAP